MLTDAAPFEPPWHESLLIKCPLTLNVPVFTVTEAEPVHPFAVPVTE